MVVINTTITLEQTIADSSVKLLEIEIVTDCVYARSLESSIKSILLSKLQKRIKRKTQKFLL